MDEKAKSPKVMRLLVVCLLSWIFCGALTWFAFTYLDGCCDLSMFSRIFH